MDYNDKFLKIKNLVSDIINKVIPRIGYSPELYPKESFEALILYLLLHHIEQDVLSIHKVKAKEYEPILGKGNDLFSDENISELGRKIKRNNEAILPRRLETHREYYGQDFKVDPALQYSLLQYTILIKRHGIECFLMQEEARFKVEHFKKFDAYYNDVNQIKDNGYLRFKLFHTLEMNSQLEFCYKMLKKLKMYKVSYRYDSQMIHEQLVKIGKIQRIPKFNEGMLEFMWEGLLDIDAFSRNYQTQNLGYFPNIICFDVDNFIDNYCPSTEKKYTDTNMTFDEMFYKITMLNQMIYQIAGNAFLEIRSRYSLADYDNIYLDFLDFSMCEEANKYFNNYLDTHKFYSEKKLYGSDKDITFQHFKILYKIKPDK